MGSLASSGKTKFLWFVYYFFFLKFWPPDGTISSVNAHLNAGEMKQPPVCYSS